MIFVLLFYTACFLLASSQETFDKLSIKSFSAKGKSYFYFFYLHSKVQIILFTLVVSLGCFSLFAYSFLIASHVDMFYILLDLSDSPVSMWMQQSGVAVRVCQRVQSVHQYNSGKINIDSVYALIFFILYL